MLRKLKSLIRGTVKSLTPNLGYFVPEGEFSEYIPPDALINLDDLANIAADLAARLGSDAISSLLSRIHIFDDSTYLGAFAEGFTYSLVRSSANSLIESGSFEQIDEDTFISAVWAGTASSLSSDQATSDFQGGDGKASSAQEFFGSGVQESLKSFASSEGDVNALATGAVSGMLGSDTTGNWVNSGEGVTQILKGAGVGALQSSANGLMTGDFNGTAVLNSAIMGGVNTDAFAGALPFTGDDPRNSAFFGAFNSALGTTLSGGDIQTTLYAAGAGALGSNQSAEFFGGGGSLSYRTAGIGYESGVGLLSGQSAEAVGVGALMGYGSYAAGWTGNQVSNSVRQAFRSTGSASDAEQTLRQPETAESVAEDESFAAEEVMNASSNAILETLENEVIEVPDEQEEGTTS